MSRPIDADALKAHYSWLGDNTELTKRDLNDIVDVQPTMDVAPVVRCAECRHRKDPSALVKKYGEVGTIKCTNPAAPSNNRYANEKDFCSYGERVAEANKTIACGADMREVQHD